MYTLTKVYVPEKYHARLKRAITKDRSLTIRIDPSRDGGDEMLLTPGQIIKLRHGTQMGEKTVPLRMSRKQVKVNVSHEGGFLSLLLRLASKALPMILGKLASALISSSAANAEKPPEGSGLFLGKRGYGTGRMQFHGEGIVITPAEDRGIDGLYLQHDKQVYKGHGLLLGPNSPFQNVPLLGLIL